MNTASFSVLAFTVIMLLVWAGGIVPAAVCLAAALACGMAVLNGVRRRASSAAPGTPHEPPFPWAELCILGILAVTVLSALPLPPSCDALMGQTRNTHHATVLRALLDCRDAGLTVDTSPWFSLTRNRAGTLRALLLLAAVFGVGTLAAGLSRRGRLAWLSLLTAVGVAAAIAGHIGQWWLPQRDTLWWVFPIPHVLPGPVGGFVNRNHFGGFLAMLIPMSLGLAAWAWMARRRLAAVMAAAGSLTMTVALLMSLSRGAVLALAGGLALTVLTVLWRRTWRVAVAGLAIGILLAGSIAIFPHRAVQERVRTLQHPADDSSVRTRLAEWRETLRVWPHYPLIGAGANALRTVYPQHRQTTSAKWLVHAENMPVEWLAESGLVGVLLAAALGLMLVRRTRSVPPLLPDVCRLGVMGALLVAGLHALWDFAMLVPACAVVLASLVGLLLPPQAPASGARKALRLAPGIVGVMAAAVLATTGLSDLRRMDSPDALSTMPARDLSRALVWAPSAWQVWYHLGMEMSREGVERNDLRRCILGERLVSQAGRYDPNNYRLWYQLGKLRLAMMDYDGAEAAFARAKALRPWLSPPPIDRPGGSR